MTPEELAAIAARAAWGVDYRDCARHIGDDSWPCDCNAKADVGALVGALREAWAENADLREQYGRLFTEARLTRKIADSIKVTGGSDV